ncbi:MAG: hypothetical protein LBD16_03755 [Oscillospiraceae bacterium]|nr:hypothetical protein [Oscillospiraceae bacterium]
MFCGSGNCMCGYQLGVPLITDNDWKFFDKDHCGSTCAAGCEFDEPDPDIITKACCANGCCKQCSVIGGDAPYLVPKSLACGRTRKRGTNIPLPGITRLPGKGSHTLVCIRAGGVTDLSFGTINCGAYEISVSFKIPIEVVLVDCCGYIFTIKSTITVPSGDIPALRIPLGFQAMNIANGSAFLYLKVKVRLCDQVADYQAGQSVSVNVLIEGCVQKFMPYGLVGDPNNRLGPYFCA